LGIFTGTLGTHFKEHCSGSLALLRIKAIIGTEIYRILRVVSNSCNVTKIKVLLLKNETVET
jgi:hypothetical protein